MSRRASVFVLGLTVGDYLAWNWSLTGNHDVLALVSGLTLPPLALISFWVLAMGAMRGLAAGARALRGQREAGAPHTARPQGAAARGTARAGVPRTAAEHAAAEASRRIAA